MKRLFAIGDIHGCLDPLKELIEKHIQLTKGDRLILLGDYIDRGSQSKQVVDYIIELQKNNYDIIPLMGNHEALLLDSINNEDLQYKWLNNGGNKTLKSFQVESAKDIPLQYINFFNSLPYFYHFKNFIFVHAGFNDSHKNPFQDKYSMLWKSQKAYSNPLLSKKIIIHGHQPISIERCKKQIENNNQVINIDTGCVYSHNINHSKLTSIELIPNTRLYFV
ncbi:metallophosphoesterase family protein [Flammeovirga sp. OC4]|uniref:metallophosphoesterase family protein n=1 Tax=Flammeovirga sp. OC4 TaxID=1382345 RepID=UPI00069463AA|nr:metallophosphoesterase family protein [Flammeovirga sp. OC4]